VLIAAAELQPLLKQSHDGTVELFVFSDLAIPDALETIVARRPSVVAIEHVFAATTRGAALIERIKADAALDGCEVRILAHDGRYSVAEKASGGTAAARLDSRGTRRAERHAIAGPLEVLVDGNPASLVDLSRLGAQVLSAAVLKPNQRVRISLADARGTTRVNASVAWAAFEIPPKTNPRYRAGLEFIDADPTTIDNYCLKYRRS
jgi:hypothetical protein